MIVLSLFLLFSPLVLAVLPNPLAFRRNHSPFVSTSGSSFTVNGSDLIYNGTNAYWLPVLNTNEDIWYTLGNISARGIKVVRTWAFNDVDTVPINGTWFQLVRNGTASINDGPNGLKKLDTVVQMAEKHGIYLILSLTNNWYPQSLSSSTPRPTNGIMVTDDVILGTNNCTNNSLPRNYLSNNYGGMDLYVRQFGLKTHDQFYTNPSILNAFMNFTTQVVSRYVNSPAVFSWEIANDARCNSTIRASSSCTTETITKWHATMAAHIRSIDPNHLISAGTSGFFCTDCPKLYPLRSAPVPLPSPVPGRKKRSRAVPVTTEQILRERTESRRRSREAAKLAGTLKQDGVRIRGRWVSTATRRQEAPGTGAVYDGSYGVDSQDIMNIPDIGFGSFTLFPDQQSYGPSDPYVDSYTNTVNSGVDWIQKQAQSAAAVGKPLALTAFGLVTQNNAPDYVPFNMTTAPYTSDPTSGAGSYGVTTKQQTSAYSTWTNTGVSSGLGGIVQYQWTQTNLTAEAGTAISPEVSGVSRVLPATPDSANNQSTPDSPNDGYAHFAHDTSANEGS